MGSYVVEGKCYTSLLSIAKSYGKAYSTLHRKVKDGYPLEEVLGLVDSKFDKFEYRGKLYRTYRELAEAYGLTWYQFTYRFYNLGQDLDSALCLNKSCIPIRNASVQFNGKVYKNYKDVALTFKIKYSTLISRIDRGWSLEKAVTTPCRKVRRGFQE